MLLLLVHMRLSKFCILLLRLKRLYVSRDKRSNSLAEKESEIGSFRRVSRCDISLLIW